MKATELRIGNVVDRLVYDVKSGTNSLVPHNSVYVIYAIKEKTVKIPFKVEISDILPIQLTEEWLINFGFEKFRGDSQTYDRDDFWAGEIESDGTMKFDYIEASIKYVHQLQNLYFALTGKELKIKNPGHF